MCYSDKSIPVQRLMLFFVLTNFNLEFQMKILAI